jgi:predicted RNase H-like HicB family nuclease
MGYNAVMDESRSGQIHLSIALDREDDGRWIAEVPDLPGVLEYGATPEQAMARAEALALRVIADRLEHGEMPIATSVTFAQT